MQYLLDTHILLWWTLGSKQLNKTHKKILSDSNNQFSISIISLWEIAKLVALKKIKISFALDKWFEEIQASSSLTVLPLNHNIIIDSTQLGENFHKDPADQLITATARHYLIHLLTEDKRIIQSGVVATF